MQVQREVPEAGRRSLRNTDGIDISGSQYRYYTKREFIFFGGTFAWSGVRTRACSSRPHREPSEEALTWSSSRVALLGGYNVHKG